MIQFYNVDKVYNEGNWALKSITLHIKKGEFVFITGPSGAGKTTILKLIYLGDKASSGQVILFEKNLGNLKKRSIPYLRRNIGIIFQDFKLLTDKSVYDNVAFALRILGFRKEVIKNRVLDTLKLVGLEKKSGETAAGLSGGEQQRVCIARAIVNEPALILADEPTGNLDEKNANQVMNILRSLNSNGVTVIVATHKKEFVERSNGRNIFIESGRIIKEHTLREEDVS